MRLNEALTRLANNPRDVAALIDAGEAARALGDFEAAEGFFRRASETDPDNGRAKAGLAGALTLGGDPYSAIPLFEQAAKTGADLRAIAPERGLAYDLVGANKLAQGYYRQALASDTGGEVRCRLALSLAISGDAAGAEQALLPLLRAQDKPAWRTRAFVLAILGRTKEAVDVTNTLLPADFAQHVVPYLRYMPQLTPAQQAAAANLGKFPRASEIGRDDPRIAAYASLATPRPGLAGADAALVPQGEPLGSGKRRTARRGETDSQSAAESDRKSKKKGKKRDSRSNEEAESVAQVDKPRVAPPEPRPAREPAAASRPTLSPKVAAAAATPLDAAKTGGSASSATPAVSPDHAAVAQTPAAPPAPAAPAPVSTQPRGAAPGTATAAAGPGFDLARLPSSTAAGSPPLSPAAAPSRPEEGPGFSELFGDLGKPAARAGPAAGAVDIRRIEPPRPKPEPEKPAPPSHPSRIWVQLGIGQNLAALKFDWRKLTRQQAALFKGRKAYFSDLGRTNRMLTGPFESKKAASDFLADLAKAGIDGPYLWVSPAGQVVDPLTD